MCSISSGSSIHSALHKRRQVGATGWVAGIFAILSWASLAIAGASQWSQSGGPEGGEIRALAIHPTTTTTMYAGTYGGGVWKTTNSGTTWSAANSGLTNHYVYALAIDPATPTTLYAATNGGGVFKSTDAGSTWNSVFTGYSNVAAIAIDPSTPSTIYIGTSGGGIYKSTDNGSNWNTANSGFMNLYISGVIVDPATPSTLYAGTLGGGVYKSTDSGANWNTANTGLSDPSLYALAIDPDTPSTLYAATWGSGVFKTTDGGDNWSLASTGLTNLLLYTIAVDPSTPSTLYTGTYGGGVFKSVDSGDNWSAVNSGLSNKSLRALAVDPTTSGTLYAGTAGGVYASTNSGTSWSEANGNLQVTNVTTIISDPVSPSIIYAGVLGGGVYRSADLGATWFVNNTGLTNTNVNVIAVDPANNTTIYAGTNGGIFKSTDGGSNWSSIKSSVVVWALAVDPTTTSTLYAGTSGGGILKSTDTGTTWNAINTGLSGLSDLSVRALAIDPSASTTVYAATNANGIYKSINGGSSWSAATTGLTTLSTRAIVINPSTTSTLYTGTATGGVFKSTDSGANWSAVNTNLSDLQILALAIDPQIPTTLYAGSWGSGTFRSTDGGTNWSALTTGLNNLFVQTLAYSAGTAPTLFAGTLYGSAYEYTFDTTPNGFSFTDQTGAALSTFVNSDSITVAGLETAVTITVSGGSYKINGGSYTTDSGYVKNGDTVTAGATTAASYSTASNVAITIGGGTDTFTVTTLDDTTPDAFTFTNQLDVPLSQEITSNTITVSGITAATTIAISGGTYSINSGTYTASSGTVNNGDTVSVRVTASGSYSTTVGATLNIGGMSDTFNVTTLDDTTPDVFTFTDQSDVALNAITASNTITVTGITGPSTISVTGGEYKINSDPFTSSSGSVNTGDIVIVRVTASSSYATTVNATLTIGGVSDTFSVTTLHNTTPDAFSFTDQTGVALNSTVTSGAISVSAITTSTSILISGGTYSINGGAYTSSAGTVANGNTVTVRVTSSANYSTTVDAVLTIGGVSDTFSATTVDDTTPDAFSFTDQNGVALSTAITSNAIVVSGITGPAPISITGGSYSVNSDSFTSSTGTLNNGDSVTVKVTSSGTSSTAVNAVLSIGGVSDTFTVTTLDDTTPDAFTLTDQTGVALATPITSNSITVTGTTAAASISIVGGTYAINSGSFTSGAGTVAPGDTVAVKVTSSGSYSTSVNTTLTIGGVSDTFTVKTLDDTTPDAFAFTDQTNAARNADVTSNPIVVSGITGPTPISITGGTYSVNSGSYTGGSGSINNGDTVVVRVTSSGGYSTAVDSILTIGGVSDTFTVTTLADTVPDPFSFTDQTGVALNSVATSNSITVSDITGPTSISITGGSYSVNSGGYVSSDGTVNNGDSVTLQLTASGSYSTTVSATLTIGGVAKTFNVTTLDDTTPDAFSFSDQTGASPSAVVTSNSISVTGITAATPISIAGGTYAINGGTYTASSGTISSGNSVTVRVAASSSYSTTVNATLVIGSISDTFSVTTMDDLVPDAFSFTDQTGVALNQQVTSNAINVTGLTGATAISISGGTYAINGGPYTSSAGSVANGDTVTARITASASNSTTINATVTIGGVSDTFSVTTLDDITPDAFLLTDSSGASLSSVVTSNTISVSGISAATSISVTGGTYSVNGGAYTSASGSVSNGDTVAVRVTSSASYSTSVNATLTIGGVSDTFSVTTLDDVVPDSFAFTDQNNAALNAQVTSNAITVSGINAPTAISIAGGTYSINGAPYTGSSGSVSNGDSVTVRTTTSSSYSTSVSITLTIGGISDNFDVRTQDDTTPDAFAFVDQNNIARSTLVTSTAVTISGINADTAIWIAGSGSYSVNGGAYTTDVGMIQNGDFVMVRIVSSDSFATTVNATVTIGGLSDVFSVTTVDSVAPVLDAGGVNGIILSQGNSVMVDFNVTETDTPDPHTYAAVFASTGTSLSTEAKLSWADNVLTVTAVAPGNDSITITVTDSGNKTDQISLPIWIYAASSSDSNGDGISDDVAVALGLDPAAINGDTDADGIPDALELGNPSSPTDSDGDGVIDALEVGNLATSAATLSFSISSSQASQLNLSQASGLSVSLSTNTISMSARLRPASTLPVFSESDFTADSAYDYPFGIYDFDVVTGVGQAVLTLHISAPSIPPDAVLRKLDRNGQWQTLSNASIDFTTRTITFVVNDNDTLDSDLTPDTYRGPVGIAIPSTNSSGSTDNSAPATSTKKSKGGGGFVPTVVTANGFVDPSVPMMIMMALFAIFRRFKAHHHFRCDKPGVSDTIQFEAAKVDTSRAVDQGTRSRPRN